MHKIFRFLYLNAYSFLLFICGVGTVLIPLYRVSKLFFIPQILIALWFFKPAIRLFLAWEDKKIKYDILMAKNKNEFRAETFKIFMTAPCGRLLVKTVLKDLGIKHRYKELSVYKTPFYNLIKDGCAKEKTKIYINEVFK